MCSGLPVLRLALTLELHYHKPTESSAWEQKQAFSLAPQSGSVPDIEILYKTVTSRGTTIELVFSTKVCTLETADKGVCFFVLLNRYWGIVTVPGSIPYSSRPGVAGSSPVTLTTSLVIPVPPSSSSNGPSNYSVDNHGLVSWRLLVWVGPKFVRRHWWES